jgi:flavin-dependent dehydrogenase
MDQKYPVIVIGAGIAGVHCAELLKQMGIDVIVVEAAPFIGYDSFISS